ncbi:MAG: CheR family methyltransferase [Beijerinckiaceae bacterium]
METFADYEKFLKRAPEEAEALFQDILIGVSSFFRDPDAFGALAETVPPKLLAGCSRQEPLRVWSLGCSTGEEAYSLAIVFTEGAEAAGSDVQIQIFATDLNSVSVGRERAELYPKNIAQSASVCTREAGSGCAGCSATRRAASIAAAASLASRAAGCSVARGTARSAGKTRWDCGAMALLGPLPRSASTARSAKSRASLASRCSLARMSCARSISRSALTPTIFSTSARDNCSTPLSLTRCKSIRLAKISR